MVCTSKSNIALMLVALMFALVTVTADDVGAANSTANSTEQEVPALAAPVSKIDDHNVVATNSTVAAAKAALAHFHAQHGSKLVPYLCEIIIFLLICQCAQPHVTRIVRTWKITRRFYKTTAAPTPHQFQPMGPLLAPHTPVHHFAPHTPVHHFAPHPVHHTTTRSSPPLSSPQSSVIGTGLYPNLQQMINEMLPSSMMQMMTPVFHPNAQSGAPVPLSMGEHMPLLSKPMKMTTKKTMKTKKTTTNKSNTATTTTTTHPCATNQRHTVNQRGVMNVGNGPVNNSSMMDNMMNDPMNMMMMMNGNDDAPVIEIANLDQLPAGFKIANCRE